MKAVKNTNPPDIGFAVFELMHVQANQFARVLVGGGSLSRLDGTSPDTISSLVARNTNLSGDEIAHALSPLKDIFHYSFEDVNIDALVAQSEIPVADMTLARERLVKQWQAVTTSLKKAVDPKQWETLARNISITKPFRGCPPNTYPLKIHLSGEPLRLIEDLIVDDETGPIHFDTDFEIAEHKRIWADSATLRFKSLPSSTDLYRGITTVDEAIENNLTISGKAVVYAPQARLGKISEKKGFPAIVNTATVQVGTIE
ncbi:MAG: hypothetical protein V1922_00840, partial [bacterium]